MHEVLTAISELGLVPVARIDRPEDAVPLGRALIAGDLPVIEVAFRSEAAPEAIGRLTEELPDLLVGAGTVLTVQQADQAARAGARFVVSPGFNPVVVDHCLERELVVLPGINSPTGIEAALERRLQAVKFFPAEASGGLPLLDAMAAPFAGISFLPTGGIGPHNLGTYLQHPRVIACGGSWPVAPDLVAGGRFDEVTRLAMEALSIVLGFTLDASDTEQLLAQGSLALHTSSLRRAEAFFRRRGLVTRSLSVQGHLVVEREVHGTTIELIQRQERPQ